MSGEPFLNLGKLPLAIVRDPDQLRIFTAFISKGLEEYGRGEWRDATSLREEGIYREKTAIDAAGEADT